MDLEDIEEQRAKLRFRGAQGTTGSQASFLELFQGDGDKVDKLNEMLCAKSGFPSCYDISTQTYTRKVDLRVANVLSALGATAISIATVSLTSQGPERLRDDRLLLLTGSRISGFIVTTRSSMSPTQLARYVQLSLTLLHR